MSKHNQAEYDKAVEKAKATGKPVYLQILGYTGNVYITDEPTYCTSVIVRPDGTRADADNPNAYPNKWDEFVLHRDVRARPCDGPGNPHVFKAGTRVRGTMRKGDDHYNSYRHPEDGSQTEEWVSSSLACVFVVICTDPEHGDYESDPWYFD